MMRGVVEDMEKAEPKHDKELACAAQSLERIADNMDKWVEQQTDRFKHTTTAFRRKWISDWFSDFFIMALFNDKVHNRRFDDIVDTFRFYMPNIAESLREVWNNFSRSVKFMQQVEKNKDRVEHNHELGFWCVNFLVKTATPTAKDLQHIAEMVRENLAHQKQAETPQKRAKEVLNRQVGELLRSSPSDISASEIARAVNKHFAGEYGLISPCEVGKTENWKKHHEKKKSRANST